MGDAAVIYSRLSLDRDGQAASVAEQERLCRDYAERAGLEVVAAFADNDISASRFSRKHRPGYAAVMEALRSGQAKHVVVRETSRLYRRPRDLEDLIDLCEGKGVVVHAPMGGQIDLSSSGGIMTARIYVAVDAAESDKLSERVRYRSAADARAGKPSAGGYRAYGYTRDWEIDPVEAQVIRHVVAQLLAGDSLHHLCLEMNAKGLRTPAAGQARKRPNSEDECEVSGEWSPTTLGKMLSRPYLIGVREHKSRGQVVGVADGQWEPILSREVWEMVQSILDANPRHPRTRTYLLTGMVWCSRCDRLMTGHALKNRASAPRMRRYACERRPGRRGCGQSIDAEMVETWTAERLLAAFDESQRITPDSQPQPDIERLTERRARIEIRRQKLAEAYASEAVDDLTYFETAKRIREELDQIADALHRVTVPKASGLKNLRRLWQRADFDNRRFLLRGAVARVVVSPAVKSGRGSVADDRLSIDFRFKLGE